MITQTGNLINDDADSAVSWKAILAGSTANIAITLVMIAFGIGVGFSVVSPWAGQGISATTFTIAAGIYLIAIAMIASTIGGYLAGRLRTQWSSVHEHERYFRDSAHGFLTWAFAMVVGAAVLGGAFTSIVGGFGAGLAPAAGVAAQASPTDVYVDNLLRSPVTANRTATSPAQATQQATSPTAADQSPAPLQGGQVAPTGNQNAGSLAATRGELTRILVPSLRKGGSLSDADKTYVASIVSARTGMTQADAEQRVNQVITQAKTAADDARKSTAKFALWLVVSMLAGALSASLAAIEGGNLRNREWYLVGAARTRVVVSPAE